MSVVQSSTFATNSSHESQKNQEKLFALHRETPISTWKWNIQSGELIFYKLSAEVAGYAINEFSTQLSSWIELIHPDDICMVNDVYGQIATNQVTNFHIDYRIKDETGSWIWIQDKGSVISYDQEGKPLFISGTTSDITEIKQAQNELHENTLFYQMLIDAIPAPIFYKNSDGIYLGCNGAFSTYFNQAKKDIIGKSVYDVSPPELADVYHKKDLELFQENKVQIYESKIANSPEKIYDVVFHKASLVDSKGKIYGLVGTILDITDRKQMEKDLKKSEKKYRLIFENSPLGVMHFDKEGVLTDCNDTFVKIFGSSRELMLGLRILSLPNKKVVHSLEQALQGQLSSYEGEYSSITSNKTTYIRTIFAPIFSSDGTVEGGVGIIEDISARMKLELALSNEKKLLEATLISVGDGVISTDATGKIVFLNKVAESLTGWTQNDARNKSLDEIFQVENEITHFKIHHIIDKVLKKEKTFELTDHIMLVSKYGHPCPIEYSIAPILDETNQTTGAVLAFRDITEKQEKQNRILYLSYHDQLTGLYNRRYYEEQLKKLDKKENLPLTIAMGDVNGLKLINDSFGHVAGDELLKKVSQVIKNACRKSDIIARLGGDEFVVIFPNTDEAQAEKILKRIKLLASQETVNSLLVSISFGYETKKNDCEKIEKIFKKAEDYMYKNKLLESPSTRAKAVNAIIQTLYEKNQREEQHSRRVSELCKDMGIALQLNDTKIEELKTVGLLHDIGKIAIDDKILNKPDMLIPSEWKEIQRHSEIGYRILSSVQDMNDIASYVLLHHERWDGNGYPKGMKGDSIPLSSRIVAIADAYDAMTSERSYRHALPESVAVEELKKNAGIQFDPDLVDVFVKKVLQYPQINQ